MKRLFNPRILVCPCAFAALVIWVLTLSGKMGSPGLYAALGWLVLGGGSMYAARLLIHVFACGYVCLRPSLHSRSKRRRRLNFLTTVNAATVVVWLGIGLLLVSHAHVSLLLISALAWAFNLFVVGLAGETARYAKKLKLGSGTAWICASKLGRWFRGFAPSIPDDHWSRAIIDALTKSNPKEQASALLVLLAAVLMAVPTGTLAAEMASRVPGASSSAVSSPPVALGSAVVAAAQPGPDVATSEGPASEQASSETPLDPEPLYQALCYSFANPGDPAPSPQREQLHALWLGGAGLVGKGAEVAGCALPAEPVPGHSQVWTVRGKCGPALRSLGVAAPRYLPALLFEQAAEFALDKAHQGVLLGASSRWTFEDGDAYVVDTETGSYVLIRSETGSEETGGDELPCEGFTTGEGPYTVVPPGLIGLWLEIGHEGWVWPTSVPSGEAGVEEFVFRSPAGSATGGGRPVEARCYTDERCAAWFGGTLHATTDPVFTSINAIASMTE